MLNDLILLDRDAIPRLAGKVKNTCVKYLTFIINTGRNSSGTFVSKPGYQGCHWSILYIDTSRNQWLHCDSLAQPKPDLNNPSKLLDTINLLAYNVRYGWPVKRKKVDVTELENAFIEARNKLFDNAVDGKIGVEVVSSQLGPLTNSARTISAHVFRIVGPLENIVYFMLSRTLYAWKFLCFGFVLGVFSLFKRLCGFLSTDRLVYFMKSSSIFLVNSCAVSSRLFEMIIYKLHTGLTVLFRQRNNCIE